MQTQTFVYELPTWPILAVVGAMIVLVVLALEKRRR
jgi:hypothetical protein